MNKHYYIVEACEAFKSHCLNGKDFRFIIGDDMVPHGEQRTVDAIIGAAVNKLGDRAEVAYTSRYTGGVSRSTVQRIDRAVLAFLRNLHTIKSELDVSIDVVARIMVRYE